MFRSRNYTEWMRFFICQLLTYSIALQSAAPAFAAETPKSNDKSEKKETEFALPTQTGGVKGPPNGGSPVMMWFGPWIGRPGNFRLQPSDTQDRFYEENGRRYYGGDLYRKDGSPWGTDIALAYSDTYMTHRQAQNGNDGGAERIWGALKDAHGFVKIVTTDNEGRIITGRLVPPEKSGKKAGHAIWVDKAGMVIGLDRYSETPRSFLERHWERLTNSHREYGGNDLYRREVVTNEGIFDAYFEWDNRWPSQKRGQAQVNSVVRTENGDPIMRLERNETDSKGNARKVVKRGVLTSTGDIEVREVDLDKVYSETQLSEEERKAAAQESQKIEKTRALESMDPSNSYVSRGRLYRAGDRYASTTLPNGEMVDLYFVADPLFTESKNFQGKLLTTNRGEPVLIGHQSNGTLIIGYIEKTTQYLRDRTIVREEIKIDQSRISTSRLERLIEKDALGQAENRQRVRLQNEAAQRLQNAQAKAPAPVVDAPAPTVAAEDMLAPHLLEKNISPDMREQLKDILSIYKTGSLSDIGRSAMRSAGKTSLQLGVGALVFYTAIYAANAWSTHDTDPMALADTKAEMATPAMLMTILGFGLFAAPFFKQLETARPNSFGQVLKWNALGMLVASLGVKSIQLIAQDPNFIKLKNSGFQDMDAWKHLWDRWNGQYLVENFGPVIIHNMTTITAVVTGSLALRWATPNILRLAGARISSTKTGALALNLGLVVGGTIIYLKAYELSEYLIRADRWFKNEYLSHGSSNEEQDGANIADARDAFANEWQFYKTINWRPFNSKVIDEEPVKTEKNAKDFAYDNMSRIMFHYDAKMHDWREKQLAPANTTWAAWARKVINFNLTRRFIYESYKEAIDMIAAEKANPKVESKFDSKWVDTLSAGENSLIAATGLSGVVDLSPPVKEIGYAGTKSFTDYMIASMACGPEAEKDVVDIRGYYDKAADWFQNKLVGGWNSVGKGKSQVMVDPDGEAMIFHAPRITKEDPSNDSICNRKFVPGGNGYTNTTPARSFSFLDTNIEDLGLRKQMKTDWVDPNDHRRYISLIEYIKFNIRDKILPGDGKNYFPQWWNAYIEKYIAPMEDRLQKSYRSGVLKTLVAALADQDDWCYSGTKMTAKNWAEPRVEVDAWPKDAYMSGRCKDPSKRYLAVGVLNNLRDEFEVYMRFLFDAMTDGDNEFAAMSTADQQKLEKLVRQYREGFRALTDISLYTVHENYAQASQNSQRYEKLGEDFTKTHNEIKELIKSARQPTPESVAAEKAAESKAANDKGGKKAPATKPTPQKPVGYSISTTLYKKKLALTAQLIIAGLVKEANQYMAILNQPLVTPVKSTPSAEELLNQAAAEIAQKQKELKAQNAGKNKGKQN